MSFRRRLLRASRGFYLIKRMKWWRHGYWRILYSTTAALLPAKEGCGSRGWNSSRERAISFGLGCAEGEGGSAKPNSRNNPATTQTRRRPLMRTENYG